MRRLPGRGCGHLAGLVRLRPHNPAWLATREAVFARIREFLAGFTAERRSETKAAIRDILSGAVARLAPASRDRWNNFLDAVVDTCPSISVDEVEQVAGILAKLELADSKYGLIQQLHAMKPGDLDELHKLLTNWTVRTAKIALDEVQSRLKLIEELDQKLRDESLAEVSDLQPLFERSLWVFGAEIESLEFTSNRGISEVIRRIFGKDVPGSKQRPDFAMLPDGSAGFYSRDSHDLGHDVAGVSRLVIAEIKKVGDHRLQGEGAALALCERADQKGPNHRGLHRHLLCPGLAHRPDRDWRTHRVERPGPNHPNELQRLYPPG